jgi:dienelactone hydrolase
LRISDAKEGMLDRKTTARVCDFRPAPPPRGESARAGLRMKPGKSFPSPSTLHQRIATMLRTLPIALLLALTAVTVSGSSVPCTHCQQPAHIAAVPRAEPALAVPEYKVQDGNVVVGQAAPPSDAAAARPGKVDTLEMDKAYERAQRLATQAQGRVFKATLTPHWFDAGKRFWYRNDTKDKTKDFVLVDAEKGTRQPAFDHDKLAAALSQAAGTKYEGNRLPFESIRFVDAGESKAVRFEVGKTTWECDLTSYACNRAAQGNEPEQQQAFVPPATEVIPAPESPESEELSPEEMAVAQKKGGQKGPSPPASEAKSPDGKWFGFIKTHNLYLRDQDGKETQVTSDGNEANSYGALHWSPDSGTLVVYRTEPGDNKQVYLIESSPKDQLPAKFTQRSYPRPGDKVALHEMFVVDVAKGTATKVEIERIGSAKGFGTGVPQLRWSKDGLHFTFEMTDRGHQRFRIIEVEAPSGKTRNVFDERAETFVNHYNNHYFVQYLDDTGEILLLSEMDGWNHFYLIDAKEGKIKQQVTKGPWVVRPIDRNLDRVDVKKRQIWFRASGKNPDQDPYLIHYYRVNFDGTGLVALTAGNGTHKVDYSPDGKYLIDTYSRVDMAPVHELRKATDGSLACALEKADIAELEAAGWRYPEVFVSKGRDGATDIWGVVFRPQNFDAKKSYPIIEYIYAGPHDSHVPKAFKAYYQMMALAELGFIVVQIDGMGTANRSRAFHDVCWKNIGDAGFPDRILWIKALAQRYSYIDITRVGIYGTSAGGQNALGALLFHPDFYKVAVASCGCHDNRLDKASWNEAWMGLMGPHYEAQSNVTNAHKLVGKLLLIVGELDTNVPPESTMRVVDALIRAKKDFDLLVLPGLNHTGGGSYGERRRVDFFVRHLLGVEPPNRNAKP